jgi:AraC-like DNA-binding protein
MDVNVPGPLSPYVVSVTAYDVAGSPGVHRGLPSTTVTLVLPVDEPLDVAWAGEPDSRTAGWSSVSGLHTVPAQIRHGGRQRGVQVALTTSGAKALLGVPAAALAGELLGLADTTPALGHLPEQLAETEPPDWVDLVVGALASALARHGEARPSAEVGRALARLTRGARVEAVAREVGYSRRHLGDLVRAECGLSPKQLQRIGRFEASRALLSARGDRTRLSEVAGACGYADQAHLAREWRALAGCPPSTWLREELPFVQATAQADGARSSHE